MQIDMFKLVKEGVINIDELVTIDEFTHNDIKKLENIKVSGYVKYSVSEEIEINLDVSGDMYILDSITLDEIKYPFSFKIDEIISENNEFCAKYFKNNQNTLDIIEILWENIVLEVPISYTKNQGANLTGEGWELNGEVKVENNNPFASLNDNHEGGE
jgi:Uncharacterized ACR, COG1399.